MEEEVVEAVLASHTPQNVEKRKTRSGRKVPEGPGRFNPISEEWKDILDPAEPKPKKAKIATKGIAGKGKSLPKSEHLNSNGMLSI